MAELSEHLADVVDQLADTNRTAAAGFTLLHQILAQLNEELAEVRDEVLSLAARVDRLAALRDGQ